MTRGPVEVRIASIRGRLREAEDPNYRADVRWLLDYVMVQRVQLKDLREDVAALRAQRFADATAALGETLDSITRPGDSDLHRPFCHHCCRFVDPDHTCRTSPEKS